MIAVDLTVLTSDAFSALAPFAKEYSGYGVNMEPEESEGDDEIYLYEERGHVTGYDNAEYNALFDKYFETDDLTEREQILREAEKKLLDDAVVMPIYFMQDSFMFSDVLSNISSNYYGRTFNGMKMKDYMSYKDETESALKGADD